MWLVVRRPLLVLFVIACTVSFLASRRLSVRLIADGGLSFAFVPICQVLAFAAAYTIGHRPLPFSRAADLFFAGYTPWLLWLIGLCAVSAVTWPMYWSLTLFELSAVPAVAWSGYVDYRFFRDVMDRPPAAAARALMVQRAIGWVGVIGYFVGIPLGGDLWPEILDWIRL
jgi:hypothetical protein